ncbi:MAG: universal stress protein [Streptomycetaceae bacterium]|nr:universal stress protein [Streptomycetaceae bacterium]
MTDTTRTPEYPDFAATEVPADELSARAPRRIVVGVDGSFGADAALRWAAAQARDRELVLDIVAVWEDLAGDRTAHDGYREVARTRLQRALETLARRRDAPDQVFTAPLHGPPGQRLVERAQGAEMLVLGTTGISSPEIPGGISVYCLRHSSVPITFVPGRV